MTPVKCKWNALARLPLTGNTQGSVIPAQSILGTRLMQELTYV